jgi:hypothetical protein
VGCPVERASNEFAARSFHLLVSAHVHLGRTGEDLDWGRSSGLPNIFWLSEKRTQPARDLLPASCVLGSDKREKIGFPSGNRAAELSLAVVIKCNFRRRM